jgi:HEAT repeat protein
LVQDALPHLLSFLESADATVRGLAAWTEGLLGAEAARPQLEALLQDDARISVYLDRRLVLRSGSDLAKAAIAYIDKKEVESSAR